MCSQDERQTFLLDEDLPLLQELELPFVEDRLSHHPTQLVFDQGVVPLLA